MRTHPDEPDITLAEPVHFAEGTRASWVLTHYTLKDAKRWHVNPIKEDWPASFATLAEASGMPRLERAEVWAWPLVARNVVDSPLQYATWVNAAILGLVRADKLGEDGVACVTKVVLWPARNVGLTGLRIRVYEGVRHDND